MIALDVYGLILITKAALIWWHVNHYPIPQCRMETGSVSVCQPILSGDPDLEDALRSTLVALTDARFIWLIDAEDAEAIRVVTRIGQLYPHREIVVIPLPAPPDGINPKLFKLEAARNAARDGVLVVLDDDTRLGSESLAALIDALDRSWLATGLPFYRDSPNFFGRLLAQFVNNNSALTYLPLAGLVAPVSINGMCYALRVSTLDRLGGFEPILKHLTDDLALADRVRMGGGNIVQTPFPQEVATTIQSFGRYITQMHRWNVFALLLLRRQGVVMKTVIVGLYGSPPILLILGLSTACIFPSFRRVMGVVSVMLTRAIILSWLQWRLSGQIRHRPLISILSELAQPFHLGHAVLVKTIRWRSRHYRVYDNDRFMSV